MCFRASSRAFVSPCNIVFVTFYVTLCIRTSSAAQQRPLNIGAIIDVNTRIGREENIAMDIATQELNKVLGDKINLFLHVKDSGGKPLQASMAADYLLKENQVQAILGMDTWPEAVSVAEVSQKAEVPVLTLATSLITLPQMSTRWPFLVRMANNDYQEIRCVASLVGSYQWRRAIVIYEHNGFSSESGIQALLSNELRDVGSEVEYWLAIPPLSTLSDPKSYIGEELEKLESKSSRVFIVIGCSLEMTLHVIIEAKDIGLMGKHSVLITTSSVTNLFHSANSSVLSSLKGVIGIKTHFSKTNKRFLNFSMEFTKRIRKMYPDEVKSEPGIYALRAYDSIAATASALASLTNHSRPSSGELLRNLLSNNLIGLSGKIHFENGESSHSSTYEIINVLDSSYKELKFWSSEYGFSDNAIYELSARGKNISEGNYAPMEVLGDSILWPGRLKSIPVGLAMSFSVLPQPRNIQETTMVIGLPGKAGKQGFVMCGEHGEKPAGYCIDLFEAAMQFLRFKLSYNFECFNGTYNQLVDQVYCKKYDAAVGDITIGANRSRHVDFTGPYMETGITMVVSAALKVEENTWLFVKPFTSMMWLLVFFAFVYTMFVVWILERRSNPDFNGPRVNQLSTSLWFTFSTLFFVHRESIRSNYTRTVMFFWFITVYVIANSYQASLTSMLTIQHLEPLTDLDQLKRSNAAVGCHSSVLKYVVDILGIHPNRVKTYHYLSDFSEALQNGIVSAIFMESPYASVLKSNGFKYTVLTDGFGGFGFAFPMGSPLVRYFSTAFLELSENGMLTKLHEKWFPPNHLNSSAANNTKDQRLSPSNFKGLFLVTGISSTLMLGLYIIFGYRRDPPTDPANTGQICQANDEPHSSGTRNVIRLTSLDRESLMYTPGRRRENQHEKIQMQEIYAGDPHNQTRPLRQAMSFPGPDRRASGVSSVVSLRLPVAHSTSLPIRSV